MNDVERKLYAARTRLILEKPFLGALVLRLPLREAVGSWCTTSATDARSLYYSAAYVESLSFSQVQFVLAHEALHCGLSHFARREHRDINRWNIACDHAVNPLLIADGLELPPGALYDESYTGLSAEEIYPLISSDSDEQTLDQHLYDDPDNANSDAHSQDPPGNNDQPEQEPDGRSQSDSSPQQTKSKSAVKPKPRGESDTSKRPTDPTTDCPPAARETGTSAASNDRTEPGAEGFPGHDSESGNDNDQTPGEPATDSPAPSQKPSPLTAQERAALATQWQQRLAGAVQQATQAGKMNGSVARIIERLQRSSVPWRTLLARFMSGTARVDYNLLRPTQRRSGDAILPSLYSRQTNIVIAVDTSGSIAQEELNVFVTEVNAIKSLVNAKITLLACDRELDGPWVFEPWEQLVLPSTLQGGGGTDFTPVFDWMQVGARYADLLVYFTDACGRFPAVAPNFETLWLVKGSAKVPWGQRIQLN
jgi:predicted metal-dependent peptidase